MFILESSSFIEDSFHSGQDTSNDAMLAQMLQAELDKEYNEYLTAKEQHVNKNSKVNTLFLTNSNYFFCDFINQ